MKEEFSAGGVVYKQNGNMLILLGQHSGHHGWVFPKGIIGDHKENETKEETAVREVQEETGILATIQKPLTPVTYWYQFENQKIKKTVYYFIMEYASGDTNNHDWEMENVEWLPIENVEERLTYESDKKVWQEAKQLVANGV
jgi:8-oxo-dGTP diphosphatase